MAELICWRMALSEIRKFAMAIIVSKRERASRGVLAWAVELAAGAFEGGPAGRIEGVDGEVQAHGNVLGGRFLIDRIDADSDGRVGGVAHQAARSPTGRMNIVPRREVG